MALDRTQYKEVRQAFLYGIHWANNQELDLEGKIQWLDVAPEPA